MNNAQPTLTVYGVRGSTPVGGPETNRYGGRTICLGVDVATRHHLVVDCGTGLRNMEQALPDPGDDGYTFSVFITHYHWDHLQGLPFFKPLYDERNHFEFYGYPWEDMDVEALLAGTFQPPWFPVSIEETAATKKFVDLSKLREPAIEVGSVRVSWTRLKHPQGVTAYRLEGPRRTIVIATDHESGDAEFDRSLGEIARDAEVLFHDAQYTESEYELHYEGWGHSTWIHALEAAREAGVGKLILISHDPERSDADVDAIVRYARMHFPMVEAAYEGMKLPL